MTPEIVTEKELAVSKQEILQQSRPILDRIKSLRVLTPTDYAVADQLLAKIRAVKKVGQARVDSFLKPLNELRQAALNLRKETVDPLDDAESYVKSQMTKYKLEEARQIREAEEKRQAEVRRLEEEAAEKKRKEEAARTAPMRAKLAAQRAELEEKVAVVYAAPAPAPVVAAASRTRTVKKWRITDFEVFLMAAADPNGLVPHEALEINSVNMNEFLKTRPDMKRWPGVEVYEDVVIVGR